MIRRRVKEKRFGVYGKSVEIMHVKDYKSIEQIEHDLERIFNREEFRWLGIDEYVDTYWDREGEFSMVAGQEESWLWRVDITSDYIYVYVWESYDDSHAREEFFDFKNYWFFSLSIFKCGFLYSFQNMLIIDSVCFSLKSNVMCSIILYRVSICV